MTVGQNMKIERTAWLMVLLAGCWLILFALCGCVSAQGADRLVETMSRTVVDTAMDRLPAVVASVVDDLMARWPGAATLEGNSGGLGGSGETGAAYWMAAVNGVFAAFYLARKKWFPMGKR